jgi:hypothetical protein
MGITGSIEALFNAPASRARYLESTGCQLTAYGKEAMTCVPENNHTP